MTSTRIRFPVRGLLAAMLVAALWAVPATVLGQAPAGSIGGSLQPFIDSHTLAGVVTVVANKDKILSLDAVGLADIAAKEPMKPDTLFWIASMSKPLTGAALMILVDEGKVNMEDPVEKYLPEFKGQMFAAERDKDRVLLKRPAHPITVRNIMAHTSGLGFLSPMSPGKIDVLTLREVVISSAMSPLGFEPGTKYQYSNLGIDTAGRIIEVVSGMSYDEFLEKRLFAPLGMKDTTLWPSEEQIKRLAKSYKPDKDKTGLEETRISYFTYPLTDRKRGASPGGGYFSTASDVATFGRMVLNGGVHEGKRILSEAAVKAMTSKQTGDLPAGYGYGWSVGKEGFGHGGAYSTDLWIDTQRGLVMVLMVQANGYPGKDGGKILPTFRKAAAEAAAK